jgi:glycosyltransferase involved in cell wall biosynthesis
MLQRTIESLAAQGVQPLEIIVVDASDNPKTQQICEEGVLGLSSQMRWIKSLECGAATQRNQGIAVATQPLIWFFDDDILF